MQNLALCLTKLIYNFMIINMFDYINERYGTNTHVKHLTTLIYNKINEYIPKLIRTKKDIIIDNFLTNNYNKIKFKNDKIILSLNDKTYINEPKIKNKIIENFKLHLNIDKKYINNVYLSDNNNLRTNINHEINHLIDVYYTKIKNLNLSKSYDFDRRLKIHENKFKFFDKWLEITYIFYLMEDHEINSNVSSVFEILKKSNNNDIKIIEQQIKNTKIYQNCINISKINVDLIFKTMYKHYNTYFDIILDDFIKNVIKNNSNDIKQIFKKEIENIKRKAKKMKKKLLKTSYNFIVRENYSSLGEQRYKNIDFSNYV
jgi:hypothetical protein